MIKFRNAGNNAPWAVRIAIALLTSLPVATAGANPGDPLYWVHASDGFGDDGFGLSMAVSGNIALFGATDPNYPNPNYGSAYLFDTTTAQQLRKLTPSDATAGNRFGYSVAISGNTALVGAIKDPGPGAAYVFDVTTGQQLAEINAADGHSGDFFGSAVVLGGNRAIVGATNGGSCGLLLCSGAAYVFDVATGQQLLKLTPSDTQTLDKFGSSVAISGDKAIIGAWGNDRSSEGAAYVFNVNTGQQLYKLTAPPRVDEFIDNDFGYSVAINGNIALIGATRGVDDDGDNSGSAYLFDLTTGQPLLNLKYSDPHRGDLFGQAVALSEKFALVGAGGDSFYHNEGGGKAYLFDVATGHELAKFENADCCGGHFGYSVALSHDTAFIGTPFIDEGRVYVFSTAPEPASFALAASGFTAIVTLARKRRRSDAIT